MEDISSASKQQSEGMEQINKAVTELESVTEENTAQAEQTAASSDELETQADSLEGMVEKLSQIVSQFDIGNQIESAGEAHIGQPKTGNSFQKKPEESADAPEATGELSEPGEEEILPLKEDKGEF